MPITLVRHAEVEEEYIGKYNGHIDIALSQRGKEQAKILADKLKSEKYDKIYCSDLRRARETLQEFSFRVKPTFTKELREKSWGRHEGKSFEEIESEGIKYENFTQWLDALDGERVEEFEKRVLKFFKALEKSEENILIVTHAGVIKVIQAFYNSSTLEDAFMQSLGYGEFCDLKNKQED